MPSPALQGKWQAYFRKRGWIPAAAGVLLVLQRAASHDPLQYGGLWLVGLGWALRLWAGYYVETSNAPMPTAQAMVHRGPYRYSRHPMYLGNLAVCWGVIVFSGCLDATRQFIWMGALFLHHHVLACIEEATLRERLGGPYREYQALVPQWLGLPRPSAKGAASSSQGRGRSLKALWTRQWSNLVKAGLALAAVWVAA